MADQQRGENHRCQQCDRAANRSEGRLPPSRHQQHGTDPGHGTKHHNQDRGNGLRIGHGEDEVHQRLIQHGIRIAVPARHVQRQREDGCSSNRDSSLLKLRAHESRGRGSALQVTGTTVWSGTWGNTTGFGKVCQDRAAAPRHAIHLTAISNAPRKSCNGRGRTGTMPSTGRIATLPAVNRRPGWHCLILWHSCSMRQTEDDCDGWPACCLLPLL